MICPICHQKTPFGLPMHMLAAHGANRAQYQRRSAELQKGSGAKDAKRGSKKRGKFSGAKRMKRPRKPKKF